MRFFNPVLVALGVASAPTLSMAAADAILSTFDAEQLFVHRIQPLFKTKCLACHGEEEAKIKGGFDLRTNAAMLEGGDSGTPGVVAGKPELSPLYLAVTRTHDEWEAMPPKENDALTSGQIANLKEWIVSGAAWPDEKRIAEIKQVPDSKWAVASGVTVKTSGGLDADWTNRTYKPENLWAYQPLKKPLVPALAKEEVGAKLNPVDAFLNAKLDAANLKPAPRADRRTLIRRATFDLTGLPPTPNDIAAFVGDAEGDDAAFAKVVERLLASPHYGEHWGRHWLDVVRYADSSGFANDFARGNTWRYRDYVVRAFNDDKPYDRFVVEQLAGDEMADTPAADGAIAGAMPNASEAERLIATGFLRMGPWELTGMEVPRVARQKFLDDVTDSVGQVLLAHPLQCARCHDHKFDPIPTRDYYRIQAVFATTQQAERPAAFLPQENTTGFEEKKYLMQREVHYLAMLNVLNAKSFAAARAWLAEKQIDPAPFEAAMGETVGQKGARGRDAGFTEVRAALLRKGVPEDRIPPKGVGFSPDDYGQERVARKGLERLRWELERYEPIAFSVYSGRTPELRAVLNPLRMPGNRMTAGELEQTHILTGGDPFANGVPVTPGVISAAVALSGGDAGSFDVPQEITGRRLALARWIASPGNPLTARVMANRIWLWHFGQALAGNPNNFGGSGKKPTHPELLDWLAATFADGSATPGGTPWSIKGLHRLIMSSEAYRRAAQHPEPKILADRDPNGSSYAVFKPRRLTAEELRDAMLAVSGELNPAIGGIPARPEINREAALQPRQVMGTFAEAWQPSPLPAQRHRRSLYALKLRGLADPFMEVFNAPSPDLSCEGREASTVTPQVFALFNSEATLDRALALANRVRRDSPSRHAAVTRVFQLAYGRTPTRDELTASLQHWDHMLAKHRTLIFTRTEMPREILREAVEENTGEKFTFREPLETSADFVSDLKPADAPPETRALADLCLVLFNSNEFAYVY